ncbi:hypothetical protein Tco_0236409, partial [Tanacetum coccineum]
MISLFMKMRNFLLHDDEHLWLDLNQLPNKGDALLNHHIIIHHKYTSNIQTACPSKDIRYVGDGDGTLSRVLPPTTHAEQLLIEKERKARTILLKDWFQKIISDVFMAMDDAKRAGQQSDKIDIQKTVHPSSLTSDNVAFLSQAKASSSKHKPHHNSGSYSSYTTSSSKATPTATPGLADEVIHSFLATNADDETNAGYNDILLYSRFKQVEYKGVPHPLSGDYTPREQEDIDDSLYEYGKYGPQPQTPSPTVSNASSISFSICPSNDSVGDLGTVSGVSSTHYSTCHSNDSVGEPGTESDHSVNDDPVSTQKTQPKVPTTTQTVDPSCAQHVKPPRQPIRTPVTSSNLNTAVEEVNTGNMEAVSPSAQNEEEVFSDDNEDEMPEIRIYDKSSAGIFEQASYDDDGVITDFNNLPDEVDVITNPTLRIHNVHP